MNRVKQILIYLLIIAIIVVCMCVVWHYFRDQIIFALGWIALFILVFFIGFIVGRVSINWGKGSKPEIEVKDGE